MEILSQLKIVSIVLVLIILVPNIAQAISFGSIEKIKNLEIEKGNTGKFNLLVWNRESEPYPVIFENYNVPKDWVILVEPNEFILSQEPGGKFEIIQIPGRTIKAKNVDMYVTVPLDTENGKYNIEIKAIAGNRNDEISILHEKIFKLTVTVKEPEKNNFIDNIGRFTTEIGNTITGFATQNGGSWIFGIVALCLIVFVSWRYYKHE